MNLSVAMIQNGFALIKKYIYPAVYKDAVASEHPGNFVSSDHRASASP